MELPKELTDILTANFFKLYEDKDHIVIVVDDHYPEIEQEISRLCVKPVQFEQDFLLKAFKIIRKTGIPIDYMEINATTVAIRTITTQRMIGVILELFRKFRPDVNNIKVYDEDGNYHGTAVAKNLPPEEIRDILAEHDCDSCKHSEGCSLKPIVEAYKNKAITQDDVNELKSKLDSCNSVDEFLNNI